jgi:hypothetical protein
MLSAKVQAARLRILGQTTALRKELGSLKLKFISDRNHWADAIEALADFRQAAEKQADTEARKNFPAGAWACTTI